MHEAVNAQLNAQFDNSKYPRWVLDFQAALVDETTSLGVPADRCKYLLAAWTKFERATKELVYDTKEKAKDTFNNI